MLVVFSIDQPTSLDNLTAKWVPEVQHHCKSAPIIVVGTKMDLREDAATIESLKEQGRSPVSFEEGQKKQAEIDAVAYLECSALSGEGIQEIFDKALDIVLVKKGVLKKESKKLCCIL